VGDVLDESTIEKTFVAEGSDSAERIAAFVDEIAIEDIEVTEEIVRAGRIALGPHITSRVLIALADHISFALHRTREGASIEYPLRWEVSYLYPAEVAFSREALRIIERRRGIALPPLEAIPIALHFVNAQFGSPEMSTTVRMTEVLTEALAIIRDEYGIEIDEDSVTVARFVTHLRYLFLRESQGNQPPGIAIELHHAVQAAQPREHGCARRIAALLDEHFDWQVNDDELLYLSLHVARLTVGAVRAPAGGVPARAGVEDPGLGAVRRSPQ
jgi:beta-glucoside operon transcriptional antiterminator